MRAGATAGMLSIAIAGVSTAGAQSDSKTPHAKPAAKPLFVGGRRLHVEVGGRDVVVKGRGTPKDTVRLQVWRAGHWATIGRTHVRGGGKFAVTATPQTTMSLGARIWSGHRTRRIGRINVYRSAEASWYGPGLYGNGVACGGTLQPGTLGVANKSLPCGTKVTLRNGSHVVRVKVIDRGPYSGNREYDLTEATAKRLHFTGVGPVLTTR